MRWWAQVWARMDAASAKQFTGVGFLAHKREQWAVQYQQPCFYWLDFLGLPLVEQADLDLAADSADAQEFHRERGSRGVGWGGARVGGARPAGGCIKQSVGLNTRGAHVVENRALGTRAHLVACAVRRLPPSHAQAPWP